jgi:hypothetical protein
MLVPCIGCGLKFNEHISYASQHIGCINFLHYCLKNGCIQPLIPYEMGEKSSQGIKFDSHFYFVIWPTANRVLDHIPQHIHGTVAGMWETLYFTAAKYSEATQHK